MGSEILPAGGHRAHRALALLRQRLRFYRSRLRFIFIGVAIAFNVLPLFFIGQPPYQFVRDLGWLSFCLLFALSAWDAFNLFAGTKRWRAEADELLREMKAQEKRNLRQLQVATGQKYLIRSDGSAIMCLDCGMISNHPMDVKNRYCANCEMFLGSPA